MSAGMGLGAVPVGPSHGPAADCSLSAWNAPTLPLDTMPCGDSYDPTLLPNGNPNSTNCTYAAPGGRAVCSGGFCVCTANFGGTTGPGNSTTGCSCSMAEMLGDVWQPLMLGLCALHAALAAAAVYMLLVRLRRAFERHRSRRRRCCAVFSECCRWDRWSPTTLGHKDITSTLVVSSLAIRSVYFYRLSGAVVDERLMLPMQVTGLPMSSSDLLAAIASMVLVNDVVELAHDLSPSLSGRRCQRQLMRGIFGLTYFGMPLAAVGVETLVKDTYSRFRYYETVQICSFALGVLVTIVYFIQSRASLRRFSNMSSLALRMEAAIAYISSLTFFVTVVGFLAVADSVVVAIFRDRINMHFDAPLSIGVFFYSRGLTLVGACGLLWLSLGNTCCGRCRPGIPELQNGLSTTSKSKFVSELSGEIHTMDLGDDGLSGMIPPVHDASGITGPLLGSSAVGSASPRLDGRRLYDDDSLEGSVSGDEQFDSVYVAPSPPR